MLKTTLFTAFAAALASLPTTAETTRQETVTVWEVDTSGRPPFERRRVEVPVVDAASYETAAQPVETVVVWTTDYRGRPPFRRSFEEVPVIDAASLETSDAQEQPVTPRPFHKSRHR